MKKRRSYSAGFAITIAVCGSILILMTSSGGAATKDQLVGSWVGKSDLKVGSVDVPPVTHSMKIESDGNVKYAMAGQQLPLDGDWKLSKDGIQIKWKIFNAMPTKAKMKLEGDRLCYEGQKPSVLPGTPDCFERDGWKPASQANKAAGGAGAKPPLEATFYGSWEIRRKTSAPNCFYLEALDLRKDGTWTKFEELLCNGKRTQLPGDTAPRSDGAWRSLAQGRIVIQHPGTKDPAEFLILKAGKLCTEDGNECYWRKK